MASFDLVDELNCSICLSIYTDPVSLPCGNNFCQGCIGRVLDAQEGFGHYSCPECRTEFEKRPALQRTRTLGNIAEGFLYTHPEHDGTQIFCTYCNTPVPAVKSCVQCENSLCDAHLQKHNKSVEHVLIEPTISFSNRKCSTHNKLLEYYCCEDGTPICSSCCLAGEHRGHRVELLSEASEKKKEKMRKVLEKLRPQREETERGAQRLQERRREVEEKSAGETERVTALFRDIREQLEALEKRLLSDISSQKEKLSLTLTDLIHQLEIKKDELSMKIRHIEELCNMADPLTVLQERESHGAADNEGGRERDDIKVPAVGDLDVDLISETLLTGLAGIVTGVKGWWLCWQEATDLALDTNTAANNVSISSDRKCVSFSRTDQRRPKTPERFECFQALSTKSFTSGRHYWDMEVSKLWCWAVGVAYSSIGRKGAQFYLGNNNKSWCLYISEENNIYIVRHNREDIALPHRRSCRRIRISLDYEAGCLSFHELSEPIRHLHTFTVSFTEPLHVALSVWGTQDKVRIIS
ncbi:E3 ubiquitin-protein ligase TRIM11 [Xenopus laevis]|uniref:E3 ubiquitin-protein ligase TRIM11 n=1 Tax=Xenopus laevis TaxID=8355 RepID=A0A8J0TWD0_XENLA|nr:E3 ubiquitin-protein ligase TRIM11 [Xenopus laevis]OCT58311.1 hypothetical protein XELAEV_18002249mg [Xenopus laevis]